MHPLASAKFHLLGVLSGLEFLVLWLLALKFWAIGQFVRLVTRWLVTVQPEAGFESLAFALVQLVWLVWV